jgi:hypothetical protein
MVSLRWGLPALALLASSGCELRGVEEDDEPPVPVVKIDGEPLGGGIAASFEGQTVSLKYGVAVPLDADVELGVVDIRLSVQPVDCNYNFQEGNNYIVFIELPAPDLGTYDRTPIAFRRVGPGISDREAIGRVVLTRHDTQTVEGTISWKHTDMTSISGTFEVRRCPKPTPK